MYDNRTQSWPVGHKIIWWNIDDFARSIIYVLKTAVSIL